MINDWWTWAWSDTGWAMTYNIIGCLIIIFTVIVTGIAACMALGEVHQDTKWAARVTLGAPFAGTALAITYPVLLALVVPIALGWAIKTLIVRAW